MKRYSKVSGMHLVTCDHVNAQRYPGEPRTCGEEFRSCSDKSVIGKQLEHAGWIVESSALGDRHLCPAHAGTNARTRTIDKTFLPLGGNSK